MGGAADFLVGANIDEKMLRCHHFQTSGVILPMLQHVHISKNISKLGAAIPSVNLPPVVTCRPNAPCAASRQCYAMKGCFAFRHNKELLNGNLDLWKANPQRFEMDILCSAYLHKFFRWHSSGDIPDASYLKMMVRVAQKCPDTRFLCFTKKYELIDAYLGAHDDFPDNLNIVFSAWGALLPSNPHNLPVAYVKFKRQHTDIPPCAFPCSGYCGKCCTTGRSCWDLKRGQSVYFDEH